MWWTISYTKCIDKNKYYKAKQNNEIGKRFIPMETHSVVRRPFVRLSYLTIHIFYFFSEISKHNFMKLDRKQELVVLFQLCVFDRKTKMASDCLRYFFTSLKSLNRFHETWQEARIQRTLHRFFCFSGRSENQDGPHPLNDWVIFSFTDTTDRTLTKRILYHDCVLGPIGTPWWPYLPLISWDIFNFSSETTEWTWRNLAGSKNSTQTSFVFFGRWETKMTALALICWDNFDFSSGRTEPNLLKPLKANTCTLCPLKVLSFRVDRKTRIDSLAYPSTKMAHCTQEHDMWPFEPIVISASESEAQILLWSRVIHRPFFACRPSLTFDIFDFRWT